MTRATGRVVEKALEGNLAAREKAGPAANLLIAIEEAMINPSRYHQAASARESKGYRRARVADERAKQV